VIDAVACLTEYFKTQGIAVTSEVFEERSTCGWITIAFPRPMKVYIEDEHVIGVFCSDDTNFDYYAVEEDWFGHLDGKVDLCDPKSLEIIVAAILRPCDMCGGQNARQ
jgi:hypothetical protein